MAYFKSGSSGGICIYTHACCMDRDFTLEGCGKKGVLGNQVFVDGETGTGALLSRKLSVCVCVCVWPQKERKKGMDGWMDGLETSRGNQRTCDRFDFSKGAGCYIRQDLVVYLPT